MTIPAFDTYQQAAMRTRGDMDRREQFVMAALGLAGEVGEVVEQIKKHRFHGLPLERESMVKELGDVMWYLAAMADALAVDLSTIAGENIAKLQKRYPEKFTMGGGVRE